MTFYLALTVTAFTDMISMGAGGVLLLMPSPDDAHKLSKEERERMHALQDHLRTTEFEIPIYFAEETPQLLELLSNIGGESSAAEKSASAFESRSTL